MADRVAKGLNVLADGLRHYVVARVPAQILSNSATTQGNVQDWDALALLVFMWDHWNDLFRHDLSFVERSLISELREYRNRWAHQQKFSEGEIYRIMDNIERLLTALESGQVAAIRRLRLESLRLLFNQEIGGRDSGGFFVQSVAVGDVRCQCACDGFGNSGVRSFSMVVDHVLPGVPRDDASGVVADDSRNAAPSWSA